MTKTKKQKRQLLNQIKISQLLQWSLRANRRIPRNKQRKVMTHFLESRNSSDSKRTVRRQRTQSSKSRPSASPEQYLTPYGRQPSGQLAVVAPSLRTTMLSDTGQTSKTKRTCKSWAQKHLPSSMSQDSSFH